MTVCLHCNKGCRLTTGKMIYPNRPEFADKFMWECPQCGAYVGCHPGTKDPLGFAANRETRAARAKLHGLLDPIWRNGNRKSQRRRMVYLYLAAKMGLDENEAHVGMFSIDQCREAWSYLYGKTIQDIMSETRGQANGV